MVSTYTRESMTPVSLFNVIFSTPYVQHTPQFNEIHMYPNVDKLV